MSQQNSIPSSAGLSRNSEADSLNLDCASFHNGQDETSDPGSEIKNIPSIQDADRESRHDALSKAQSLNLDADNLNLDIVSFHNNKDKSSDSGSKKGPNSQDLVHVSSIDSQDQKFVEPPIFDESQIMQSQPTAMDQTQMLRAWILAYVKNLADPLTGELCVDVATHGYTKEELVDLMEEKHFGISSLNSIESPESRFIITLKNFKGEKVEIHRRENLRQVLKRIQNDSGRPKETFEVSYKVGSKLEEIKDQVSYQYLVYEHQRHDSPLELVATIAMEKHLIQSIHKPVQLFVEIPVNISSEYPNTIYIESFPNHRLRTDMLTSEAFKVITEFEPLIPTSLGNKEHLSIIYLTLAIAYRRACKFDHATNLVEQALQLCVELNDNIGIAKCHYVQSYLPRGARTRFNSWEQALQNLGEHDYDMRALILSRLAIDKSNRGNIGTTEIQKVKQIFHEILDPQLRIQVQGTLLYTDSGNGNFDDKEIQDFIDNARYQNLPIFELQGLNLSAWLLMNQNADLNNQRAIDIAKKALKLSKQWFDKFQLIDWDSNISLLYEYIGKLNKARAHLKRCLKTSLEIYGDGAYEVIQSKARLNKLNMKESRIFR